MAQTLLRCTRSGVFETKKNTLETFETLTLSNSLREELKQKVYFFVASQEELQKENLLWKTGLLLFGPAGSGKTAASRAIAALLDYPHITIPSYEILSPSALEKALTFSVSEEKRVVLLEDLDELLQIIEPPIFLSLFDYFSQRQEGIFWIATSRHPENLPKSQLNRPGRFDDVIRLEYPSHDLKEKILKDLIKQPLQVNALEETTLEETKEESHSENPITLLLEKTHNLSYAHLEEMRKIVVRAKIEDSADFLNLIQQLNFYLEDQIISGERWGRFLSDKTEALQERIAHVDPRLLTAALGITDIFKGLISIALSQEEKRQGENV